MRDKAAFVPFTTSPLPRFTSLFCSYTTDSFFLKLVARSEMCDYNSLIPGPKESVVLVLGVSR